MPELPVRKLPDLESAFSKRKQHPGDIISPDGKTFIGAGTEKFVYQDPQKPGKAISVYHYRLDRGTPSPKQIFYLQRIYKILFPDHLPAFHAAFRKTSPAFSGRRASYPAYVTEYIEPKEVPISHPFTNAADVSEDWNIPLPLDPYYKNFVTGQDGKERYVDTFYRLSKSSELNSIPHFMRKQGYPEENTRRVTTYIERYKANNTLPALITAVKTYIRARLAPYKHNPQPDTQPEMRPEA